MKREHFIKDLKKVTHSPYMALHFLHALHYTGELYCISSEKNNWFVYQGLLDSVRTNNPKKILSYLRQKGKEIFSTLSGGVDDSGRWYRATNHEDFLRSDMGYRVQANINEYALAIKTIKKNSEWLEVYRCAEKFGIIFLPERQHFNNRWLKNTCKKYHFFEIKVNTFNLEKNKKIVIELYKLCHNLNISNLGHNKLSVYLDFYNRDRLRSVYYSDYCTMDLRNLTAFIHEWAHFLDNQAYIQDYEVMQKLKNYHGFYSELIPTTSKAKNLKYSAIYKILKKLFFNGKKKTAFYKGCKNYLPLPNDVTYFYKSCEIFARFFEVAITKIIGTTLLTNSLQYYNKYQVYPQTEMVEPLLPHVKNFVQRISNNA